MTCGTTSSHFTSHNQRLNPEPSSPSNRAGQGDVSVDMWTLLAVHRDADRWGSTCQAGRELEPQERARHRLRRGAERPYTHIAVEDRSSEGHAAAGREVVGA